VIHPSFLKDLAEPAFGALAGLWRAAGDSLRRAHAIFVVGYSLPEGDSAASTLLLTNSDSRKVTIVNQNKWDNIRLYKLLARRAPISIAPPVSFEEWVSG
jgi:hypothetical protein